MKTRLVFLLFFLNAFLALSPAAVAAADHSQVEAQIRQLNAQEVDGLMHRDAKALAPLWADEFVVTNPYNKFITKQNVLKFVASGFLRFRSYDRRIEYLHVYGHTVIVAGSETVDWAGTMPLAGKTSLLRFTSVWLKRGKSWQEVARHANIVWTK
ncbi:MAG TPA: nuclear transport factor 2 family protein [Gammaproteobacteria bacterium]|nr:nuclear transport factor 2 family protein [Gammaproteobacteria bacterium]